MTSRRTPRAVRAILDAAGLQSIHILASGGLDEHSLLALCRAGAPIDGFGVGTSLTTSSDAPALDCAYKLQEYAGRPRRKRSEGKATWPGRKQVYRSYHADGTIAGDVVALTSEPANGEPLLRPAMRGGKRVVDLPNLAEARRHAAASLARCRIHCGGWSACRVPVEISPGIRELAAEMDQSAGPGSPAVTDLPTAAGDQDAVIEFLSDPASYGADGDVVRIDTHCSIVFLTGDRAYKLKRAIRYASLDYTTRELRRSCLRGGTGAEPADRSGTVPGCALDQSRCRAVLLTFDGEGPALDHVVVMRRFAQSGSVRSHGRDGEAHARADAGLR